MDNLSKKQRSDCMSKIRSFNTKIEVIFRRYLSKNGIKGYRIKNSIAGKPDLFFPQKKIAVFIDGCFWHKCPKCFMRPKSNRKYWADKIKNNALRDKKNILLLKKQGVHVIRFWEHQIKDNIAGCYTKFIKIYEKKV